MASKYKVSIVNYLNTRPFIEGIKSHPISEQIDLIECSPAQCASYYLDHAVDISLVPVGALIDQKFERISDFGIASNGPVSSVCLFSQVPLSDIKKIYLDYQSRTSVLLVQLLCKDFWHISPTFVDASSGYELLITGDQAGLIIGDRALAMKYRFPYVLDLGQQWQAMTQLPFVYAVWLMHQIDDKDFLKSFNQALAAGVDSIPKKLPTWDGPVGCDLEKYFTENIRYTLDQNYDLGMNTFLGLVGQSLSKRIPVLLEDI